MPSFLSRFVGSSRSNPYVPADPVSRDAQSTDEYITIEFLEARNGCPATGHGWLSRRSGYVGIICRLGGSIERSAGFDLFEAFMAARQGLEAHGYIPRRGRCRTALLSFWHGAEYGRRRPSLPPDPRQTAPN